MGALLTGEIPVLSGGRVRLRDAIPETGPAVLAALDEAGSPCSVEVVDDDSALGVALQALATRPHPGLPVILDQVPMGSRHLIVEHPGPGRPLSEALTGAWTPWSVARVARMMGRLCESLDQLHRDTGGRLPFRITAADLWLTPQGALRLRTLGLSTWADGTRDPGVRMAEAMRDLVRVLRVLSPESAAGEFLWVAARCEGGDPSRCYRSFAELAEALGRPVADRATRVELAKSHPPLPPPPPKPRPRASWVLATGLILALIAAVAWWQGPRPRPLREPALAMGVGSAVEFRSLWTGSLVARMELGEIPGGLAASPDGSLVAASQPLAARLTLLDMRRGVTLGDLVMDPDPQALEMDEDGQWLFVTHPARSLVTVVNLHPRRLLPVAIPARSEAVLAVDPGPLEIAHGHSQTGQTSVPLLYFSSSATGTVTVVQLKPITMGARVPVPGAGALAVSPGGRRLYVANRTQPLVEIRDARTLDPLETWPLARPALRLVWAGTSLWAVEPGGLVERVDGPEPPLRIPAGTWKAVVSGPRTDLLWALGGDPSCILTLQPSRGEVVGQSPAPAGAQRLAVVPWKNGRPAGNAVDPGR